MVGLLFVILENESFSVVIFHLILEMNQYE